jgi:hypothetical protein
MSQTAVNMTRHGIVFWPQVYHHFVILELVHGQPEFCPGASLEAMTKEPLTLA